MNWEFIIRLFIAALLGGVIGLEREYRAKEAGMRTHFLVALGSALFMIISEYGFDSVLSTLDKASYDPSRIASQVVTGIGFIGAGTIIFQKHVVRGLTTAAGLWVTSAIGLTCGAGLYMLAVATTVLVLICMEVLNFFFRNVGARNLQITFSSADRKVADKVLDKLGEETDGIESYSMKNIGTSEAPRYQFTMEVRMKRSKYQSNLLKLLHEFGGVEIENIE